MHGKASETLTGGPCEDTDEKVAGANGHHVVDEASEVGPVRTARKKAAPVRKPSGQRPVHVAKYGDEDYCTLASRGPCALLFVTAASGSFQVRECRPADLGHMCRECKKPITALGDLIAERRGARVQMRYHRACFSDDGDPRSQDSAKLSKWYTRLQSTAAPAQKYSKMRTKSHWATP